jgi:hypothetical protein
MWLQVFTPQLGHHNPSGVIAFWPPKWVGRRPKEAQPGRNVVAIFILPPHQHPIIIIQSSPISHHLSIIVIRSLSFEQCYSNIIIITIYNQSIIIIPNTPRSLGLRILVFPCLFLALWHATGGWSEA